MCEKSQREVQLVHRRSFCVLVSQLVVIPRFPHKRISRFASHRLQKQRKETLKMRTGGSNCESHGDTYRESQLESRVYGHNTPCEPLEVYKPESYVLNLLCKRLCIGELSYRLYEVPAHSTPQCDKDFSAVHDIERLYCADIV